MGRTRVRDRRRLGPATWPAQWLAESDVVYRAGMLTLAAALAALGVVSFVTQLDVVSAELILVAALLTGMVLSTPRKRKSTWSDRVRIVELDPTTGAIVDPVPAAPAADGRVRGVLVPADPRARLSSLCAYGTGLAATAMLWPSLVAGAEGASAIVVSGLAVVAIVVSVAGIAKTIGDHRNAPKVVCTPTGLWINDRAHGAFLSWEVIAHVIPVRKGRRPAVGLMFSDGFTPHRIRMFPISVEAALIRRDRAIVDTTPLMLDAAVLLLTVQLALARNDIRTSCDSPDDGVLHAIRNMYDDWMRNAGHNRHEMGAW